MNKQINKVKERIKSVLDPCNPASSLGKHCGLYGAQMYDNARRKLVPVFGTPSGKSIKFKKSDESMIVAPASLEGCCNVYALTPNSKRLGGFVPENSYVFADANTTPVAGDLAVFLDADFDNLTEDDTISAQIALVRQDNKGKLYGHLSNPEEKITGTVMHKIIMIVMK